MQSDIDKHSHTCSSINALLEGKDHYDLYISTVEGPNRQPDTWLPAPLPTTIFVVISREFFDDLYFFKRDKCRESLRP